MYAYKESKLSGKHINVQVRTQSYLASLYIIE